MHRLLIFDTHAHLDLPQFDLDRQECIARIHANGFPDGFIVPKELEGREIEMVGVLLPGIDAESSLRCVELATMSPKLCPAVAIHPNSAGDATEDDWNTITQLASRGDVVAIGETGLDRYWDHTPFDRQIDFLRRHLELARRTEKPVLIHCRDAWDDLMPILHEYSGPHYGVIHAFSGEPRQALDAISLGFHISFAGSLTYRNAKFAPLWEAAKAVPLDRLLIETDAPYMTPHPYRGKLQRNEPAMAAMVALRLAELRGENIETVAELTANNARKLFVPS